MTTPNSLEVLKLGPGGDFIEEWHEHAEQPGRMVKVETPIRLRLVGLPETRDPAVSQLQGKIAKWDWWKNRKGTKE